MDSPLIWLKPSAVARSLGAVAAVLLLASIGGQLAVYLAGHEHDHWFIRLMSVDEERNIPTGFSTLLLLFAALLLALVAVLEYRQATFFKWHWAVLACGFLLMAADEAWSFHERLIKPVRLLLGNGTLGVFYYAWVIPGMALVLALALFYRSFLRHLPAKTRRSCLIAAALYLGGAIGLELIGGRYDELYGIHNLNYSCLVTIEEGLEMAGSIVFIWSLLAYIANEHREVRLRFGGVRGDVAADEP